MILLFDIGNTNTHVGLANSRRVVKQADVSTAGWFNGMAAKLVRKLAGHARLDGAVLCSVVPCATPLVCKSVRQLWHLSARSARKCVTAAGPLPARTHAQNAGRRGH